MYCIFEPYTYFILNISFMLQNFEKFYNILQRTLLNCRDACASIYLEYKYSSSISKQTIS